MVSYFTPQSISGYNTSPPSDDGSQVAANEITWAKHKGKLADPVKSLAESINSEMANMSARMFLNGSVTKAVNYTVLAADLGKIILASNGVTVTALAVATAGDGFVFEVLNTAPAAVTIAVQSGEDLNGTTDGTITLQQNDAAILRSTGSVWHGLILPGNTSWTYETLNTTTGGTTIDFTSIPSGVTEIDVFCLGVSLSGTEEVNVRIGPSGGLETAGYVGGVTSIAGTPTDTTFAAANQFVMNEAAAGADTYILIAHLILVNRATNLWSWTGQGNSSASGARYVSVGYKALAGALNLLTVKSNSSDTFDVNGGVQIRHR